MAAAFRDAGCCALGVTYWGRRRGSIPLTASNTDAETSATTLEVTKGLVPPAITVSFIIPIHCRTGSGLAAEAGGALTAKSAANAAAATIRNTQGPKNRLLNAIIKSSDVQQRCGGARSRKRTWRSARQQKSLPWVNLLVRAKGEFVSGSTAASTH